MKICRVIIFNLRKPSNGGYSCEKEEEMSRSDVEKRGYAEGDDGGKDGVEEITETEADG